MRRQREEAYELVLEAGHPVLSSVKVVRIAEQLDTRVPAHALAGDLPIDVLAIRREKRGGHRPSEPRIEAPVLEIDDEVRQILNRVPDREIVEVEHPEPLAVDDQ